MLMHSATACSQSLEAVDAGEIPRSAKGFHFCRFANPLSEKLRREALTVEHVLDGIDRRGRREGGRELLAKVVEAVEVVGEADALPLRLGQQALSELVGSFHQIAWQIRTVQGAAKV